MSVDIEQPPLPTSKAHIDCTHCVVCGQKFGAEDERYNYYVDDTFVGVVHAEHYQKWHLPSN